MRYLRRATGSIKLPLVLCVAAAAAVSLSGCGAGAGDTTVAVRMVDAVPSTVGADFLISGVAFVEDIGYKAISTYGYVNLGANDVAGYQTGTDTIMVPDQAVNLTGAALTIVATGIPGSPNPPAAGAVNASPKFLVFQDDNATPSSSQIRVRVINASPDSGAIDVSLVDANSVRHDVASNITYTNASAYATVAQGTYSVTAYTAGTATSIGVQAGQVLSGGRTFTIFVEGPSVPGPVAVVTQWDA